MTASQRSEGMALPTARVQPRGPPGSADRQHREVGDHRLVVAARDRRLAHGSDDEPGAGAVADEDVVELQQRQPGRPGAGQAAAALVVGVAEPVGQQPRKAAWSRSALWSPATTTGSRTCRS